MHNFCTWRRVHHQEWKNHGTPALHSLNIMEKDNEDNDKWRMLLCWFSSQSASLLSPQCTFMIYDYTSLKTAKNIITVVEAVEEKTNAKQLQQNQWNLECEFSNHQKTLKHKVFGNCQKCLIWMFKYWIFIGCKQTAEYVNKQLYM